jgi:hypothetical protein
MNTSHILNYYRKCINIDRGKMKEIVSIDALDAFLFFETLSNNSTLCTPTIAEPSCKDEKC